MGRRVSSSGRALAVGEGRDVGMGIEACGRIWGAAGGSQVGIDMKRRVSDEGLVSSIGEVGEHGSSGGQPMDAEVGQRVRRGAAVEQRQGGGQAMKTSGRWLRRVDRR